MLQDQRMSEMQILHKCVETGGERAHVGDGHAHQDHQGLPGAGDRSEDGGGPGRRSPGREGDPGGRLGSQQPGSSVFQRQPQKAKVRVRPPSQPATAASRLPSESALCSTAGRERGGSQALQAQGTLCTHNPAAWCPNDDPLTAQPPPARLSVSRWCFYSIRVYSVCFNLLQSSL